MMSEPPKPSLDERLQAIIQSLELLVSFHRDLEKRHEESEKQHEDLQKRQEDLHKRQEQDAAAIHQLALIARDALASVQSLERTATAHQRRLDDHGQRIERLEDK